MSGPKMKPDWPLFVRLPAEQGAKLDRAADALGVPKARIVAHLVERHVDPDTPPGLQRLGELAARVPLPVGLDASPGLPVGSQVFWPARPPEVLTAAEAAALLQVPEGAVDELAERGELPGRRIAGEWRFAREALIAWLSAPR